MDDTVLAVDLVGGLGQELARRLLPQDGLFAILGGLEQVCRIRLAITELDEWESAHHGRERCTMC